MRCDVYELPDELRVIVEGVWASPRPINHLEVARKYGAPAVHKLINLGHLCQGVMADGVECLIVTPLTVAELSDYFRRNWTARDVKALKTAWKTGDAITGIAADMDRASGDVLCKAWEVGLVRPSPNRTPWLTPVPAWKVKRLRSILIDAERRGPDKRDAGKDLDHRAAKRRFREARRLIRKAGTAQPWPVADLHRLRSLRDGHGTIRRIAREMGRQPRDVAVRLTVEGRSLNGRWSEDEDAKLIQAAADGLDVNAMMKALPCRTKNAIWFRLRTLGLARPRPGKTNVAWTEDEERTIITMAEQGKTYAEIADELPGRTESAVNARGRTLNIVRPAKSKIAKRKPRNRNPNSRNPWTRDEDYILLDGWARGIRGKALADRLPDRSGHACRQHLKVLLAVERTGSAWDMTEDQAVVRGVAQGRKPEDIAEFLGRTVSDVRRRVRYLKLKPTKHGNGKTAPEFGDHAVNVLMHAPIIGNSTGGRRSAVTPELVSMIQDKVNEGGATVSGLCDEHGISRATIYRALERFDMAATG